MAAREIMRFPRVFRDLNRTLNAKEHLLTTTHKTIRGHQQLGREEMSEYRRTFLSKTLNPRGKKDKTLIFFLSTIKCTHHAAAP